MEYKDYVIENDGTFGMKTIKTSGRGSVNLSLRGTYTSWREAMKAVDNFIANRGKDNVETISPGGSK